MVGVVVGVDAQDLGIEFFLVVHLAPVGDPIRMLANEAIDILLLHFFRCSDNGLAVPYLQGDRLSIAFYKRIIYFPHVFAPFFKKN